MHKNIYFSIELKQNRHLNDFKDCHYDEKLNQIKSIGNFLCDLKFNTK